MLMIILRCCYLGASEELQQRMWGWGSVPGRLRSCLVAGVDWETRGGWFQGCIFWGTWNSKGMAEACLVAGSMGAMWGEKGAGTVDRATG